MTYAYVHKYIVDVIPEIKTLIIHTHAHTETPNNIHIHIYNKQYICTHIYYIYTMHLHTYATHILHRHALNTNTQDIYTLHACTHIHYTCPQAYMHIQHTCTLKNTRVEGFPAGLEESEFTWRCTLSKSPVIEGSREGNGCL